VEVSNKLRVCRCLFMSSLNVSWTGSRNSDSVRNWVVRFKTVSDIVSVGITGMIEAGGLTRQSHFKGYGALNVRDS